MPDPNQRWNGQVVCHRRREALADYDAENLEHCWHSHERMIEVLDGLLDGPSPSPTMPVESCCFCGSWRDVRHGGQHA